MFKSKNISRIMAEGGDFMVDLSHKLARRLDIGAQSLEEQIDQLQLKINELGLGL